MAYAGLAIASIAALFGFNHITSTLDLFGVVSHENDVSEFTSTGLPGCDALIGAGMNESVYFPSDAGYQSSIESYFSGMAQAAKPLCIVRPTSAEDVSRALKALVAARPVGNWNIAVRGGGHSHWLSNNIDNGVTIDLSQMNQTAYDHDSEIAKIDGGARWGSVFKHVEQWDRSLTGGREGNVGVAGLALGGGLSFYSAYRGFTCDDIVNYQVVLANGQIVDANKESNADLFKALKGGGGNFGIVTRFDMRTFAGPPTGLYGGLFLADYQHKDTITKQFFDFVSQNEKYPDNSEGLGLMWRAGSEDLTMVVTTVDVAGKADATLFQPLEDIPKIMDDRKHRTYGDMITDYTSPSGPRSVWYSLCFHNDLEILKRSNQLYEATVKELQGQFGADSGVMLSTIAQPLLKSFTRPGAGKNVLGLDETLENDSILWLIQAVTTTAEQASILNVYITRLALELERFADSRGANTKWRYLNYVNRAQNPLGSYGEANVRYMKKVAAKYDPEGVFQTRVPGGFKISRV